MAHLYSLYLERVDPARNMHRFYGLSVQPTLFGEHCVVRHWGRIGGRGREKTDICRDEREALERLLDLTREKRKRNYRPKSVAGNRAGQG